MHKVLKQATLLLPSPHYIFQHIRTHITHSSEVKSAHETRFNRVFIVLSCFMLKAGHERVDFYVWLRFQIVHY